MRYQCLAVCTPGIEEILHGELAAQGVRRIRTIRGGVTFDATTRQLYAANVWSRTATRVLARAARFRAVDFAALEREAGNVSWDEWLDPTRPTRLRVTAHASRLYHTAAIEERLRRVIGAPGADDDDPQLVVVRVTRDEFTISIDASGEPLYKRGWRQRSTRSPLRETLAAAMILASEWSGESPLVDPFCGSGTIAIEAALLATGRAPGAHRSFAFERWPRFEPGTWASVHAEVERSAASSERSERIVATDRDDGAIAIARENAADAGVGDLVTVRRATISELEAPSSATRGWLIANPPYGRRVSAGMDVRDLFARFGDVVRASLPGWNVGLLTNDLRAVGHARLDWTERIRTDNGGIPVRYVTAPAEVAS